LLNFKEKIKHDFVPRKRNWSWKPKNEDSGKKKITHTHNKLSVKRIESFKA
jgi:hypothetical protein